MSRLRSPIWWFGGKGMMVAKLLPLFPSHYTYVEPFGGGASMLMAKEPSPVEVYNDVDLGLVGFFRVLRNPEQFQEFYRLVSLTPYSREEFYHCRDTWEQTQDPIECAYRWFVVARMSFGGKFGSSWGFVVTQSRRKMAGPASNWLSCIDQLPAISERLLRVQIEHNDFRKVLDTYDTPNTLFYCDPPYVHSERSSTRCKCEMSNSDHQALIEKLLILQGKVLLSGYVNEVYLPLEEAGWERRDFKTVCYAVGHTRKTGIQGEGSALAKQPRIESVWISPNSVKRGLF